MNTKKGNTVVFVTILCFAVLGLGALVGWQYHRSQMEQLLLENLSLKEQVDQLEKEKPAFVDQEEPTSSAELATKSSQLDSNLSTIGSEVRN